MCYWSDEYASTLFVYKLSENDGESNVILQVLIRKE